MGHPSRASEFPNDNAAISDGAIWVCSELIGPAKVETPRFEPVPNESFVLFFEDEDAVVDGPVELELRGGSLSVAIHSLHADADAGAEPKIICADAAKPAAESDGEPHVTERNQAELFPAFAHFESALATALMAHGASRAAALVPRLLRLESLPADLLNGDLQRTLQGRGYLDGAARYSQPFRELCGAWTAVLRGSSQDLAACGTTTLDRFGADLLAALLAVPKTRAEDLRRELRRAGIAAFGVLAAA